MTLKQSLETTEKFLDSLDILSYTKKGESLEALMERLESACSEMDEIRKEPFDFYLFNWMDQTDFLNYLQRRYGDKFRFQEKTTYYYTRHD